MNRSRVRSLWVLLSALLTAALVLSGCAGGGSGGDGGAGADPQAAPADRVEVSFAPAAGKKDVDPGGPISASVSDGRFRQVALTDESGEPVEGKLADDGRTWKATEPLGYGTTYTWSGKAVGADGAEVPVEGRFSTVQPKEVVRATIAPVDNRTVGVAMPISIKFDAPVTNKAAVQKALRVNTSKPVEGSWAWLNDQQVDWRPKEYWPEHTEVSVRADLYGVPYGDGKYGKVDLTTHFSIGRAQIVKADVDSHRIAVMRDGEQVASYPASYGRPGNPELHTHNGTYIVMSKNPVVSMDNPEYGYTDVEKKWAVRISNHGEYIHENEQNRANIGERNTSHGCINLTNADAKAYYDSAMIGDPVEVTGSSTEMPAKFAVYDWMLSWKQWKSMSAL